MEIPEEAAGAGSAIRFDEHSSNMGQFYTSPLKIIEILITGYSKWMRNGDQFLPIHPQADVLGRIMDE